MLVIEGPDMVGKTTFARLVAAACERRGLRVETDKFGTAEAGPNQLEAVRARTRRACVCDRLWPSEVVYGSVARGAPGISPEEAAALDAGVRAAGGMYVVIHAAEDAYERLIDLHYTRDGQAFPSRKCRAANRAYGLLAAEGRFWSYVLRADHRWEVRLLRSGEITYPAAQVGFAESVARSYVALQRGLDGGAGPR